MRQDSDLLMSSDSVVRCTEWSFGRRSRDLGSGHDDEDMRWRQEGRQGGVRRENSRAITQIFAPGARMVLDVWRHDPRRANAQELRDGRGIHMFQMEKHRPARQKYGRRTAIVT